MTMSEFLHPRYFDVVIKATLITASQSIDDEEDLCAPSTAVRLGYTLKWMLNAKMSLAIRNNDQISEKEATDFRRLMTLEWGETVNKNARVLLAQRRFNTVDPLPLPEDMKRLADFLKHELAGLDFSETHACFQETVDLVLCRLLVYNKQRSGELEAMQKVIHYLENEHVIAHPGEIILAAN